MVDLAYEQLQRLIVEMATNNPTWGEERIADELLLKIGIRISISTVSLRTIDNAVGRLDKHTNAAP